MRGGGPLRRRPASPCRDLVRDVLVGAGWTREAAVERRRGPRALGVARGPGRARRRRSSRPTPEARLPELVARARRAGRGAARPHGAGRHPGLAARGQGPGVGRGLPGRLLRRAAAITHGRHRRRRSRRSGACSTSASPGPGASCACRGPGPAPRAAGPRAARRGSSTAPRASSARAPAAAASRRARAAPRRQLARPALPREVPRLRRRPRPPPRSARSAAATTARPATTRRLFEALREWRLATARAAERPGLRRLHRRHPDRDRRGASPRRARRSSQISGVGAGKLGRYGAQVLSDPARRRPCLRSSKTLLPQRNPRRSRRILTISCARTSIITLPRLRASAPNLLERQAQRLRWPAGAHEEQMRRVGPDGEHHHDDRDADHPRPFRVPAGQRRPPLRLPVSAPRGPLCPRSSADARRVRGRRRPSRRSTSTVSCRPPPPRPSLSTAWMSCTSAWRDHLSRQHHSRSLTGRGTRHPGSAAFLFVRNTCFAEAGSSSGRSSRKTASTDESARQHRSVQVDGPPPAGSETRPVTRAPNTMTGTTRGGDTRCS